MSRPDADAAQGEKDTSSATWKFEFEDTVNADPLAKGACLKVLRVYLNFCTKAKPEAFCSLPTLMLLSGSSKPRVLRAKATMEQLGYMVPLYVTDEGSMMYRLVNARKDAIAEHIHIGRETLAAEKRERKRRERSVKGRNETIPPEGVNLERNVTPVGNETLPNTVDEYRRDSCSEGRGGWERDTPPNPYGSIDDDLTVPFAVPTSEEEANEILSHARVQQPPILNAMRSMLMRGELTPLLLLHGFEEMSR